MTEKRFCCDCLQHVEPNKHGRCPVCNSDAVYPDIIVDWEAYKQLRERVA